MSMDQTQKFCKCCGKPTLHARPGTNHILHLLISLLCLFWIPVWILASLRIGGWKCQTCGYGGSSLLRIGFPVVCILAGLVTVGTVASSISRTRNEVRSAPSQTTSTPTVPTANSGPVDSSPIIPVSTEAKVDQQPPVKADAPKTAQTPVPEAPKADASPEPKQSEFRTWTDATGKHKTEAKFSGMNGQTVKLVKPDGKAVTLPFDKLSEEDQKWIEDRKKARR